MISVITGDIINSRHADVNRWLEPLYEILDSFGESPEAWEIYRGDSFQLEISDPKEALKAAIQIKAKIKQLKGIDIRMCIGLGEKSHSAGRITESNGSAFVHSGKGFESLKKNKQNLSVVSGNKQFDKDMNLFLRLTLIAMDNWTPAVAEFVSISFSNDLLQEEIAKVLNITQASVSERRRRSYIDEISEVEELYRVRISNLTR